MRSNQESPVGALLIVAALIGGFLWWFSSSKDKSAASKAERSNERAHAAETLRESHNRFATAHGAVWVDKMNRFPTNTTGFGNQLTVDVQQILMPGKPVAFDMWFPDVEIRDEKLVLTGSDIFSGVHVALVMDNPSWLDLIRTNIAIRVAAEINSVTRRRVVRVDREKTIEEERLRASGRAIALEAH